jgi:hypothetical protein
MRGRTHSENPRQVQNESRFEGKIGPQPQIIPAISADHRHQIDSEMMLRAAIVVE